METKDILGSFFSSNHVEGTVIAVYVGDIAINCKQLRFLVRDQSGKLYDVAAGSGYLRQ